MKKLDNLFYASSVAVIGASTKQQKASYQIIKTMIREGYTGFAETFEPETVKLETEIVAMAKKSGWFWMPG